MNVPDVDKYDIEARRTPTYRRLSAYHPPDASGFAPPADSQSGGRALCNSSGAIENPRKFGTVALGTTHTHWPPARNAFAEQTLPSESPWLILPSCAPAGHTRTTKSSDDQSCQPMVGSGSVSGGIIAAVSRTAASATAACAALSARSMAKASVPALAAARNGVYCAAAAPCQGHWFAPTTLTQAMSRSRPLAAFSSPSRPPMPQEID